jgi:hypothetical protein
MTEDLGTTSWTYHAAPADRRAERFYQTGGLAATVDVNRHEVGWFATVYCPDGKLLAYFAVRAEGEMGLGLAASLCDFALGSGHPSNIYRIDIHDGEPGYAWARNVTEASALFRATYPRGSGFRLVRTRKVNTRETRALFQREIPERKP